MNSWTGRPCSARRVLAYVAAAVLVLIGNECWARHVGADVAAVERAARASDSTARLFHAANQRYLAAAKSARQAVGHAIDVHKAVIVTGKTTIDVHAVPHVVPPEVVDLITAQDTAIARLSVALLQADSTIAKAHIALATSHTENRALRRRIPRLGFRSGLVVGAGLALLLRLL